MSFGRRGFGQGIFGRKGLDPSGAPTPSPRPLFGNRTSHHAGAPFDRHFAEVRRLARDPRYPSSGCRPALELLSAEERGELLVDLADRPGIYDGGMANKSPEEQIAYSTLNLIWSTELAVQAQHLGALLTLLTGNKSFRTQSYYNKPIDQLLRLIDSAIKQGAYLSSGDCEALAQMASDIRGARKGYRKTDVKRMLDRAERIEKLAGAEVSATEFLMQRCEGAENPFAISPDPRPNAQFWADLLAETVAALEEIRQGCKSSTKPAWLRKPDAFAAAWPAVDDVSPRFGAWEGEGKPFALLNQHNGLRNGFADPKTYRGLPRTLATAAAHSRYIWSSDQIPGLDVLGDLEDPAWTALVEHLITQRRATRATAGWRKEALALCRPLGLATVEARLHDWLALFASPPLDRAVFTDACNGERFAHAIDLLEEAHGDWPERHAHEVAALGRAVAMVVASEPGRHGLCRAFAPGLNREADHVYKNARVTDGICGLSQPKRDRHENRISYDSIDRWLRVSVENEEFLRGAVWLVALMPDRARAIAALADVAQTCATYLQHGEDGMRSKIVANAAIATLIDMGGSDIDAAVLRLSKAIDNCTINPPLFRHLNREG